MPPHFRWNKKGENRADLIPLHNTFVAGAICYCWSYALSLPLQPNNYMPDCIHFALTHTHCNSSCCYNWLICFAYDTAANLHIPLRSKKTIKTCRKGMILNEKIRSTLGAVHWQCMPHGSIDSSCQPLLHVIPLSLRLSLSPPSPCFF